MRVQTHFSEPRIRELHRLMREYPFATLVAFRRGRIDANHLPLLLVEGGEYGVLQGHAAKALDFGTLVGEEVLAIFQADHAYVSPSWYPSKQQTGRVVPTWNYSVVHAHGRLNVVDDPKWVRAHLERMTNTHESGRDQPWHVSDAPAEYTEKMLNALVGLEVNITELTGKFKLSQNRTAEDRTGVLEALSREPHAAAHAVADMMKRRDVDDP